MSSQPGTPNNPVKVAIVGAGPAGLYAADALLKKKNLCVRIDVFDQLPTPYGLVRYGVAPDHEKIKSVTRLYDKTLARPEVRFFGSVKLGSDLLRTDLLHLYDQILYAVGAQTARRLHIPGEDLAGSLSATEFVAWYNGHPDHQKLCPDLRGEHAVVVGAGNVALDVARILTRTEAELAKTDIADYALAQLAQSNLKSIYVLARRGPAQARFSPSELKGLAQLEAADVVLDRADLNLDPLSTQLAATDKRVQRMLSQMHVLASAPQYNRAKRIFLRFFVSPRRLSGQNGRVEQIHLERNRLCLTASGSIQLLGTGETDVLPADLVVKAIGYRGVPLDGVAFDESKGTILHEKGRVLDENGVFVGKEYVAGWAKRGPSGIIGTNRPDAAETVEQMVADLSTLHHTQQRDPSAIETLLQSRGIRFVTYEEWHQIDETERALGQQQNRPRVKLI